MDRPPHHNLEQDEYRQRQEEKAKRRQKKRNQRLIFLGACVLAVLLLVLCVVLIIRAILSPDKPKTQDTASSTSLSAESATPTSYPTAADPSAWNLLVINAQNPMPDNFDPELDSYVQNGAPYYFDARMLPDLTQMISDCNSAGNSLQIVSGSRSAETQNRRYNEIVNAYLAQGLSESEAAEAARRVEPPYGTADHQACLSVDFGSATVTEAAKAFAETPEYEWLITNAANYGFILRFPANKFEITGIDFQPYHFRYVGKEDARIITDAGICLEEYVAQKPTVPPAVADSSGSGSGSSTSEAA